MSDVRIDGGYDMPTDVKIDADLKLPVELVPVEGIWADARAIGYGAKKYTPWGWLEAAKDGYFDWSVSYGALQRHMLLWMSGQDYDEESGLSHLDHAGANLKFLQTFVYRGIGLDDRPVS